MKYRPPQPRSLSASDLKEILAEKEGLRVEFKLKYEFSAGPGLERRSGEFVKDILSLLNTAGRDVDDFAYLVIGAKNERRADGTRDSESIQPGEYIQESLLQRVNAACIPPLRELLITEIELEGTLYGVIILPPSPHVHRFSKDVSTPKHNWLKNQIPLRTGEEIIQASPEDVRLMEEQKAAWSTKQPRFKKVEPADEVRERLPYFFGTRQSTFVGRKKDRRILEQFLTASSLLSWMLVIGPGGSGKSRLALELLRDNSTSWNGGFLDNLADVDWAWWRPKRDTLFIIDYADTRTKDFTRACSSLYSRESPPNHRVRFLLLHRPGNADSPQKDLENFYGVGTDRVAMESTVFREYILLGPLDANDIWKIIKEVVPHEPLKEVDRKTVLESLAKSDPQRRPLFALFAAHAIAGGRNVRQWSARALTQWVLDEERERYWAPAGVGDKDLNLLALSTLVGGLSFDDLRRVADGTLLPLLEQVSSKKYSMISGRKVESSFPPLEPDILGELFVLDHFQRDDSVDRSLAPRLASLAWRLEPKAMSAFLWRAFGDFGMPMLRTMQERKPDAEDEAMDQQLTRLQRLRFDNPPKEWLTYATPILSELKEGNDQSGHATECEKIRALYEVEPQDDYVCIIYAQALMGQISLTARTNDIATAAAAFKRLDAMSDQFPNTFDVCHSYTKAVAEMLLLRGHTGADFAPKQMLDKISSIASRFPEGSKLEKWREICDLCVRIAYRVADAGEPHVCALCGRPSVQFAIEEKKHCVLCMLGAWAHSNNHVRHELVRTIESSIDGMFGWIHGPHFEHAYLKGEWSRGTFADILLSVAQHSEESDTPSEAPAMLGRLYELLEMHLSEPHLLDVYAQMVPTVIQKSSAQDLSFAAALHMIDRLESCVGRLSSAESQTRMLAQWVGLSKFAIVSSFAGQCPLAEILRYLGRAEHFFKTVPNKHKHFLTFQYVWAVFHIIQNYEDVGVISISKTLLERLRWLAGLYANVRDISAPWHREVYGLALATMIKRHRKSGSPAEAAALTADLESLVTAYPDEKVLGAIRQQLDDEIEAERVPEDAPAPPR